MGFSSPPVNYYLKTRRRMRWDFIGDFAIDDFFENRFPVHGSKLQIFHADLSVSQSHQVMEIQHGETDKELDSFSFTTDNHPVLYIQSFFKCKGTACKFIHILFLSSE